MSTIIIDKTYLSSAKIPQKSSGPRESCEDITCMECGTFIEKKDYPGYKICKKQCFIDKRNEITACCQRSCANLGSGTSGCLQACNDF
jgi:hypothetical protein